MGRTENTYTTTYQVVGNISFEFFLNRVSCRYADFSVNKCMIRFCIFIRIRMQQGIFIESRIKKEQKSSN